MRRKYQLEYKRSAHKGRFFGAAGLPYSIETVAKFMFARQSVALLARGVRPLRRHTKKCAHKGRIFFGAADRGRTDTVSLPQDFESSASANSTTAASY